MYLDLGTTYGDLITPNYIAHCIGGRGGERARNLFFFCLSLSPLSLSTRPLRALDFLAAGAYQPIYRAQEVGMQETVYHFPPGQSPPI